MYVCMYVCMLVFVCMYVCVCIIECRHGMYVSITIGHMGVCMYVQYIYGIKKFLLF